MYKTPDGKEIFVIDGHIHFWDGSPENQANIHGKQFIEHLPIPPATPPERANIEALVMQLIAANDAAQVARVPHQKTLHERNAAALRDQIEGLVTALFGLSPADMALARAVPIPA